LGLRITRTAQASWQGTVPHGGGRIALGSGAMDAPFTLKGRVEEEPAANPEELIGAANAACFTMSLASLLEEAGHPPADLRTTAKVRLEQQEAGFSITRIELDTTGDVPGVDAERFVALAEQAKATCPVSRALAGTEILLTVRLHEGDPTAAGSGTRG
jgi:lipoyl-dependent peroxiredoxin